MGLKRAVPLHPFLVTAGTDITPVFANDTSLDVFWLMIAVRTMGGDAWVYIGDNISLATQMLYTNDFYVWDCPYCHVFDAAKFFCISELGNVVLEVTGMRPGY